MPVRPPAEETTVTFAIAFRPITALVLLALAGCTSGQLPNGATLTIAPAESRFTIVGRRDAEGRCSIDPARYVDLPFVIALRDAQGSPIGGAELSVHTTFSANFYSGYPVLELYEDRNGNGVIDEESERVDGEEDGIVRVMTSRYGGEHTLLLRKNLSCAYRGHLHAFVDGVATSAELEVIEEEATAQAREGA